MSNVVCTSIKGLDNTSQSEKNILNLINHLNNANKAANGVTAFQKRVQYCNHGLCLYGNEISK